jgi:hypothetical protein
VSYPRNQTIIHLTAALPPGKTIDAGPELAWKLHNFAATTA